MILRREWAPELVLAALAVALLLATSLYADKATDVSSALRETQDRIAATGQAGTQDVLTARIEELELAIADLEAKGASSLFPARSEAESRVNGLDLTPLVATGLVAIDSVGQRETSDTVTDAQAGVSTEGGDRTYRAIEFTLGATGRADALLVLVETVLEQLESAAIAGIAIREAGPGVTSMLLTVLLHYGVPEASVDAAS